MMLPTQQTEFPHLEANVQDFGGTDMYLGQQQNDHLFDPTLDTGLNLGTSGPELPWLNTEGEFSRTSEPADPTGISEHSDYAVADTPHSMDPYTEFSVSETVSSQQEVQQQDAGFLDQDQQIDLSGNYQYYGAETDLAISQDMFSPNVW
ncbi:hypothetical protein SLS62_004177 [Diatrype stigma]|uniref:Uncharacterized protein n=1 Tax=Diatrype stigma TaxID=117547 RepID=A0AAN9UUQ3_9PEZI